MTIYRPGSKNGYALGGFFYSLFGLFFVAVSVLWTLRITTLNGNRGPESPGDYAAALACFGAGTLAIYLGWRELSLHAYEIRLPGDGTVEFVSVIGSKTIPATNLTVVEKSRARFGEEDEDPREIHFRWNQGTARLKYFRDADALIANVQALNPDLRVTGEW